MFDNMREIRRMLEQYDQLPRHFRTVDISLTKQMQEITAFTRAFDLGLSKQAQEIANLYQVADAGLFRQVEGLTTVIRNSSLTWDTNLIDV